MKVKDNDFKGGNNYLETDPATYTDASIVLPVT